MNVIQIPKQEIFDLLEDKDTIKIKEYATKNDCHAEVYVFKQKNTGTFYKFTVKFSYNEGLQIFGHFVDAIEVKPVEKTVVNWVEV